MNALQEIPIEKIHLGRNPRTKFDPKKLEELAQSIQARGQHQPIVVEPYRKGYLLVMGERRLRAAQLLGKTIIQAYVRERTNHNGRERFLDALVENDQRAEMTPMERARAYRVLQDEYKMTIRQISRKIGKSETVIGNLLLLTDLDEEIQEMIDEGWWHDVRLVRGLLAIEDRATRVELARQLWAHKAMLKTCLKAVGDAQRVAAALAKTRKLDPRKGAPARQLAEAEVKPTGWDMLKQLGRLPDWDLVIHSAEQTCDQCPLRSMASRATCEECGAVAMLRKLTESCRDHA